MVEELSEFSAGQFETVSQLIASSVSLQMALVVLVVGLIIIVTVYRKFSSWIQTQKFSYTRPHISRFVRTAMLAFFAIGLVSSVNAYIQAFELFDEQDVTLTDELSPSQTFAKILNTINILVIGYTISHLIPIALNKREKTILEREDFESWKELKGFKDDNGDLFHKIFKWVPPKILPEDLTKEEFEKNLQTKEGLNFLENYRTSKNVALGSYEKLVTDPFEEWKKAERKKYEKYCIDFLTILLDNIFKYGIIDTNTEKDVKYILNKYIFLIGSTGNNHLIAIYICFSNTAANCFTGICWGVT